MRNILPDQLKDWNNNDYLVESIVVFMIVDLKKFMQLVYVLSLKLQLLVSR